MAFNISKYAETLKPATPAGERDIEVITAEIIQLKQDAGSAILGIGDRLIEAKAMLSHGEWLPWLEDRVEFSVRTANNFMRLSREWRNSQALANLGATKALTLLALPPDERETFMAENHLVDGAEKTVIDMTSRELEKAIRERDEARKAAEAAQADARSAEESRAKMEADMKALEAIHRSAQEGEAQARDALVKAQAELKELRERPVDVAVEVDQEAVEKARAEAVAEMQAKVDAAEKQRKEAEKKRKEAEKALSAAKKEAGANAAILSRAEKAEAELAEARRQLEAAAKAENASIVNQNGDLAMFNVLFSQTQEQVNKMHGLRLKLGKDDGDLDTKLKTAINALADAVRRCAE
nr:DUF3102 domain-containing protein [uncultured Oscillibacter sp.]